MVENADAAKQRIDIAPRDERRARSLVKGAEWASGAALIALGLLLPATSAGHVLPRLILLGACVIAAVTFFSLALVWLPSARAYSVIEPVQEIFAVLAIPALVATTGGADSPYFGFLFYPVMYSAFFLSRKIVIFVVAAACVAAAAPLFYDNNALDAHWLSRWIVIAATAGTLAAVLFAHKRRLHKAEFRARREALTDPLTGVLNRLGFETALSPFVDERGRWTENGALVLIDIDDFKAFNTQYGHAGGDAVICSVASAIARATAGDGHVFARIGGDEFALFVPGIDESDAKLYADRCMEAVARCSTVELPKTRIFASAGYATSPRDGETVEEVLRAADGAMYLAKASRKSRRQSQPDQRVDISNTGFGLHDRSISLSRDKSRLASLIERVVGDRPEESMAAIVAWIGAATIIAIGMAVPGSPRDHLVAVSVIASFSVVIAVITYFGWRHLKPIFYSTANVVSSAMIGVVVYLTDGSMSPFLPLIFFVIAFAATYFATRAAAVLIGIALFVFTTPFAYLSGDARQVYVITFLVMATAAAITAVSVIYSKVQHETTERNARELSVTDPLTKVLNRRGLAEAFDAAMASGCSVGLCLIDLDNFKRVNTSLGHHGGDRFLIAFANSLSGVVRESDHIARVGGDEFAVLVTMDDPAAIIEISQRAIEAADLVAGTERWRACDVTASVGYATSLAVGTTLDDLIDAADGALMTVKTCGKNAFAAAS